MTDSKDNTLTTRALLVMDVIGATQDLHTPDVKAAVTRAIAGARSRDDLVVYARLGFRSGHPEVSRNNVLLGQIADAGMLVDGDPSTSLPDWIEQRPEDVLVVKKRVSAFAGSDLDVVLRSRGVDEIAVCGMFTSGVVLSTVRDAADRDYSIVVLEDACADPDDEVHQLLMERVLPMQARVVTADECYGGAG